LGKFKKTSGKVKNFDSHCQIHQNPVKSMVDLAARFDSNLTFMDHISEKINKPYSVLGIIKRNFIYMNEDTFILGLLYKLMVRPHVEFANSVWCPYKINDLKEIEKIQKRATKLVIKLKNKSYIDRLIYLNLPTLKYRRLRGEMIEVFKITHNIYNNNLYSPQLAVAIDNTERKTEIHRYT